MSCSLPEITAPPPSWSPIMKQKKRIASAFPASIPSGCDRHPCVLLMKSFINGNCLIIGFTFSKTCDILEKSDLWRCSQALRRGPRKALIPVFNSGHRLHQVQSTVNSHSQCFLIFLFKEKRAVKKCRSFPHSPFPSFQKSMDLPDFFFPEGRKSLSLSRQKRISPCYGAPCSFCP